MELQQDIDRITDILRRDDGISGAMHYTEQISWILFLKFLDDLEREKESEAILTGKPWKPILPFEYRWSTWACPKTPEGELNLNQATTGDDLSDFVNDKLFPFLKAFSETEDINSFQYKIGAIFQFLENRIVSGHTLREVLNIVDKLSFQSETELFELSLVYEHLLQNMGDAGGYAGEFYTPRPLVKAIVSVMDAQPGQTIYDGAAGSCGFLVENFEHFKKRKNELTTRQWNTIQTKTFYGIEKTSLAYVMGMMNMILHGVESPNLYRANTLTRNIRDIQESERYDLIFSNPPFGGKEKNQIQQNFPVQSNATELLFLQHFMRSLKHGGKAAIVVPEGILFQTGNAFAQVKKELLENFNLHTILSLPPGVFLPYSAVKTNVLFFNRAGRTRDIWYYECVPEQKLTKNRPLSDDHLADFIARFRTRDTTDASWTVPANSYLETVTSPLAIPAGRRSLNTVLLRKSCTPSAKRKNRSAACLTKSKPCCRSNDMEQELYELPEGWEWKKLAEICTVVSGTTPKTSVSEYWNGQFNWITPAELNDTTDIIFETQRKITEKAIRECSLKCMPQGTVLLSSRAPIGKVAIAGQKMYCNQGFKNLICSSSIFNKFLFYYLKSKTDYLNSLGKGTTFKEISKKIVENIYIPRPILLPEQQRIAHKLDTVLGRIGKAISLSRENLESLNTLFASLLQQAFDPLGKAENENLYELPEGWEWKPLAELCKFENGDRGKNYPSRALFVNEGIPVINASNLNGKTIDLHNLNFISEDKYNLISNGKVRKNDLLFCLRGSLGKCALVTNLDKGVIASSLVIVRPLERILNGYLLYYFNSSICHNFIRQYNNGAAQPNLSAHCLSKFLIPFSSLPEQRRIAHKLDVLSENIEAQKKTLQEKIDELNNLKNSILDAAFRGQL